MSAYACLDGRGHRGVETLGGERAYEPVLFCFLLDITDFLGDLLQQILVVCVLVLELWAG
jgi:hypothetical protein